MKGLLVGVDGSPNSLDALRWSAGLAGGAALELTAARVFTPRQSELSPGLDAELHLRQKLELDGWCDGVSVGRAVSTELLEGDPPSALLIEAHRLDALLVVGSRGSEGFNHPHLGSVANRLVHYTTVPLAVVPSGATAAPTRLVVGVDGSPEAAAAVDLAAGLAARLAIPVTAVYGFVPPPESAFETDDAQRREAAADARRWAAPIAQAGLTVDIAAIRTLHPVDAIRTVLEAHPEAIGCVGVPGLSEVTANRPGSVALHLVHHSSSPVILVPPARQNANPISLQPGP